MKIDLGSIAFNANIINGGGTPSWGTALGQSSPDYKITYEGAQELVIAMTHCFYNKNYVYVPLGKGGKVYCGADSDEIQQAAVFSKTFINGVEVGQPFALLITIESSEHHLGRKSIKYSNKIVVKDQQGEILFSNDQFYKKAEKVLNITEEASWFVYAITPKNQDELHFSAIVVNSEKQEVYEDSYSRKNAWIKFLQHEEIYRNTIKLHQNSSTQLLSYLSAIRTKPFLLLAGISGTGKSRIVKELAYSCCPNLGDLQSDPTSPGNYCLVEVKPNWNDSTELLGYETMLEGGGYHLTKFVKFVVKAMQHKDVPFFVCLDEMNLAPVEQYFAEFLSVLESRKDVVIDGEPTIKSEPLIDSSIFKKYKEKLFVELFGKKDGNDTTVSSYTAKDDDTIPYFNSAYTKLMEEGLRIPRNLIVVGTVNMDDTTYQFSRKVIDRAMTIEMNEVNLDNMLATDKADALTYPTEVVDSNWFFAPFAQSNKALPVMAERAQLVAKIKETIGQTNENGTATPSSLEEILGKTPFRIAYRVVNELILHFYALRWQNAEADFAALYNEALDNILMMKVLPRIEGNEDLVKKPLAGLQTWTQGVYPKSYQKIEEMLGRLDNHFTSFWP